MNPDDPRLIETRHSAARPAQQHIPPQKAMPDPVAPGSPPASGDLLSVKPNIINLLYILSFFTAFTGIAGVVLCHIWVNDPAVSEWEKTHLRYHIRTFWLGLAGILAGAITLLLIIGFFIWLAVAIWMVVRCVMSFNQASKGQPMPDPQTLVW